MLIKRRNFLKTGSLASASLFLPQFLKALEPGNFMPSNRKILVIIQLSGGNDGLNTVIPIRNDIYYKNRPRLAVNSDQSLKINDETGLHPELKILRELHDNGELAILNSVGYPNPDRSHFRSMDIWHTGSNSNEYLNSGWLGRFLDAQCCGSQSAIGALEMDDVLTLALKGEQVKGLALKDPARLFNTSNNQLYRELAGFSHDEVNASSYLYKTMAETLQCAATVFKESKSSASKGVYPNSELAKGLKHIASLIFSEINTQVYYISLGSFDTHVNQSAQQSRLFRELNDALSAFIKDLKSENRFGDVLISTFSEFGRRVAQNASGGTDHGTANNMFLIGGGLKRQGLLNPLSDLTDLNEGDLQFEVDFKRVYATLLKKWMGADDSKILHGSFEYLDFI